MNESWEQIQNNKVDVSLNTLGGPSKIFSFLSVFPLLIDENSSTSKKYLCWATCTKLLGSWHIEGSGCFINTLEIAYVHSEIGFFPLLFPPPIPIPSLLPFPPLLFFTTPLALFIVGVFLWLPFLFFFWLIRHDFYFCVLEVSLGHVYRRAYLVYFRSGICI